MKSPWWKFDPWCNAVSKALKEIQMKKLNKAQRRKVWEAGFHQFGMKAKSSLDGGGLQGPGSSPRQRQA